MSRLRVRDVQVPGGSVPLPGTLVLPAERSPVVIFAHGSGSGRHSPRNAQVADALNGEGLGTLLFDLLTPEEGADRRNVFDVPLLAGRLAAATAWLESDHVQERAIGYFGASTGAAAALWAAADPAQRISAVVSRGGRPDLAGPRLSTVSCPTLLIVGGDDREVLELNLQAKQLLGGEAELVVVPGAGHLFEQPGTLEAVAGLAGDWFTRHLQGA